MGCKRWASLLALCLLCFTGKAQIVNRLRVDSPTFERYAYGRMQQYNPDNLVLADSLYREGVRQNNFRYKCLALSLEMPVRFSQGEYGRMEETAAEIKELLADRKDLREFYFPTLHEYCEYLVHIGKVSEAMLEARAMERLASAENKPLGKMYAYRIIGLIQSYRDNAWLAIQNFTKAVRYSREARAEQDLPNLYILIAQEYVKMRNFPEAENYCMLAEEFQDYFPSIRLKALMTRAYLYNAEQQPEQFWQCYESLTQNPLYKVQASADTRYGLDIIYLRSKGLFDEALAKADSLGTALGRSESRQGIYADQGVYDKAYAELYRLLNEKDSVYIKVQNEDLAILDAEMNNAQLREEAQRLKSQNHITILVGFLVLFAIAFSAILVGQWQLRHNLEEMREKNNQNLATRRAFQKAMEAKEKENEFKIRILQNRKTNILRL